MAVNAVTTGRTFVVNYSVHGHDYTFSFADSRREELIDELRRQADDPEYPLTDMDFLRLVSIIRFTAGMDPGNVVDATSPHAKCCVSCLATAILPSAVEAPFEPVSDSAKSEMISQFDNDGHGCFGFALGFLAAFCGFVFLFGSAMSLLLIAQLFRR
jgi:hypothetical protein